MMSNIEDIKARHGAVRGYFADQKGTDAHLDRSWLIQEVERLRNERDDAERVMRVACEANKQFKAEVERLRKTISQFLDAISGVPMRAIDCDQEEVYRLQRKLERAAIRLLLHAVGEK